MSFTPLSGSLLTARATVKEMIATLQPPFLLNIHTFLMADMYPQVQNKEKLGSRPLPI